MVMRFWVPGIASVLLCFVAAFAALHEHLTPGERTFFLLVFVALTVTELVVLWIASQRVAQERTDAETAANERHALEMKTAAENHAIAIKMADDNHAVAMSTADERHAQAVAYFEERRAWDDEVSGALRALHRAALTRELTGLGEAKAKINTLVGEIVSFLEERNKGPYVPGDGRMPTIDNPGWAEWMLNAAAHTRETWARFDAEFLQRAREARNALSRLGLTDPLLNGYLDSLMPRSGGMRIIAEKLAALAEQVPNDE
ncbi:MAG: hypothetical protein JWO85_2661 [Candidatus Eremiobacteraeota bacterium]|nr:hypothetical protein [Candidatus Eremiobacteraeota bacterium]